MGGEEEGDSEEKLCLARFMMKQPHAEQGAEASACGGGGEQDGLRDAPAVFFLRAACPQA